MGKKAPFGGIFIGIPFIGIPFIGDIGCIPPIGFMGCGPFIPIFGIMYPGGGGPSGQPLGPYIMGPFGGKLPGFMASCGGTFTSKLAGWSFDCWY